MNKQQAEEFCYHVWMYQSAVILVERSKTSLTKCYISTVNNE